MGHLNSFSDSGGGNLNKNFPKIQMPGGLLGGGVVEASILLVHYMYNPRLNTTYQQVVECSQLYRTVGN